MNLKYLLPILIQVSFRIICILTTDITGTFQAINLEKLKYGKNRVILKTHSNLQY